MRPFLRQLVPAALLCAAIACNNTTAPSTNATFTVNMRDSPFTDAKAVFVTFSALSAHLAGGASLPVPFAGGAASRTCDLKKLTTAQDVLGTGPLTAGHYTQVRLVVASATIYFDNPSSGTSACGSALTPPAGRNAPVAVPSAEVLLNREFDLTTNTTTTMLLDFDGDQSIKQTGNGAYLMTPVIGIVSVQ
jgi:uncharacterized protein DUF4382